LHAYARSNTGAVGHAPALAKRFSEAGLAPADLAGQSDLDRLPVLKKERLLELQAADPAIRRLPVLRSQRIEPHLRLARPDL